MRIKVTIHHAGWKKHGSRSDQTAANPWVLLVAQGYDPGLLAFVRKKGETRLSEDLLEHGDPGRIAAEFL